MSNIKTKDTDESKSKTGGSTISGFDRIHTSGLLRSDYEWAEICADRKIARNERAKTSGARKFDTYARNTIANIWKHGAKTTIGNCEREIKPDDICPKVAFISKCLKDGMRIPKEEWGRFLKFITMFGKCSIFYKSVNYTANIKWDDVRMINKISKDLGYIKK